MKLSTQFTPAGRSASPGRRVLPLLLGFSYGGVLVLGSAIFGSAFEVGGRKASETFLSGLVLRRPFLIFGWVFCLFFVVAVQTPKWSALLELQKIDI